MFMKKLNFTALVVSSLVAAGAHAAPLAPKAADVICRKKALAAAHFIAEANKPFVGTYKASKVAEISTPIRYEFTYPGISEVLFTVDAYAYPDDKSCTIGSVVNNIAGND
jgi:hypothetical protein